MLISMLFVNMVYIVWLLFFYYCVISEMKFLLLVWVYGFGIGVYCGILGFWYVVVIVFMFVVVGV